jgi:hypothetical protein
MEEQTASRRESATRGMSALPPGFIAGALDYRFDYPRMAEEIRRCREHFVYSPPHRGHVEAGLSGRIPFMSAGADDYRRVDSYDERGIEQGTLRGASTFYLRNSAERDAAKGPAPYAITKTLGHEGWFWRPELEDAIPYTIECIESLPYARLGIVRAIVCEDTFMPTHRDADAALGKDRTVGISLIPATGHVGMRIWNKAAGRVEEVRGNCLIFDDACWHGVPMTRGVRITIRVFGEPDFGAILARLVR